MTKTQFIEQLTFLIDMCSKHIKVYDNGDHLGIRIVDDGNNTFCPLTFVCFATTGKYYKVKEYLKAGTILGFSYNPAYDIARASDGANVKYGFLYRKNLTEDIRKAAGLKP